nr:DMT family transporter [uncultured Acetatifactor sp.]
MEKTKELLKKSTFKSSLMLFLAAFIWGTAFVAQSVGMDYLGPLSFNGARFLMGSLVLAPVICFNRRSAAKKHKENEGKRPGSLKTTIIGGVCCGLALCAAALLQQIGMLYTTVGKAGFITTLYIILVPVFGIFLKKRIPGKVWGGAAIAAFGMYLLCMSESLSLGRGDALVFLCAILFSVHILVIDHFSPRVDGVELSCIQFLTAGIIGSILAFLFEKPDIGDFVNGIVPLAYAGILSSGVAYTLQVVGQRDTDPTVASLILSLESVVSVLAGWVVLRQALTGRELAGCGLVFCAVILVQLPGKAGKAKG